MSQEQTGNLTRGCTYPLAMGSWQVEALWGHFLPDEGDLLGAFPSPCLGPPFPLPLALGVFFAPGSPFAGAFGFPGAPGACVSACATAPLALAAAFRSRSSFSLCFFSSLPLALLEPNASLMADSFASSRISANKVLNLPNSQSQVRT